MGKTHQNGKRQQPHVRAVTQVEFRDLVEQHLLFTGKGLTKWAAAIKKASEDHDYSRQLFECFLTIKQSFFQNFPKLERQVESYDSAAPLLFLFDIWDRQHFKINSIQVPDIWVQQYKNLSQDKKIREARYENIINNVAKRFFEPDIFHKKIKEEEEKQKSEFLNILCLLRSDNFQRFFDSTWKKHKDFLIKLLAESIFNGAFGDFQRIFKGTSFLKHSLASMDKEGLPIFVQHIMEKAKAQGQEDEVLGTLLQDSNQGRSKDLNSLITFQCALLLNFLTPYQCALLQEELEKNYTPYPLKQHELAVKEVKNILATYKTSSWWRPLCCFSFFQYSADMRRLHHLLAEKNKTKNQRVSFEELKSAIQEPERAHYFQIGFFREDPESGVHRKNGTDKVVESLRNSFTSPKHRQTF